VRVHFACYIQIRHVISSSKDDSFQANMWHRDSHVRDTVAEEVDKGTAQFKTYFGTCEVSEQTYMTYAKFHQLGM